MEETNTQLFREVNERIRETAGDLEGYDDALWTFSCECGEPGCHAQVDLPLSTYDALVANDEFVLARGHMLADAQNARRRAQELREESQAVRAQAQQAVRRSRRLRDRWL